MTKHLCIVSLAFLSLGSLIGCQTAPSAAVAYPAPSFDAPRMAPQPAPTPAPSAARAAVTRVPTIASAPHRPTAAPMAGIPLAWAPPVAPRPWRWIIIHHSATTTGGAAAFDKMHRAKGWDELGYDFVIGNGSDTANGQVEVGPRWTKQKIGAHAKTSDNRFNEYGIGICLVGNFDMERPTPQQLQSLDKLVAYLMVTYHITPDNILRHGDTKSTACPGKFMNVLMVRQQATILAGASQMTRKLSASAELLKDVRDDH